MTLKDPLPTLASRVRRTRARLAIGLVAGWLGAVGVHAHDLGRSESAIAVRGSEVRARVTLDLLEFAGLDHNGDGRVSYGELDDGIDRVYAVVKGHLSIHGDDPPVRTVLERYAVRDDHVGQLDLLLTFNRPLSRLSITSTLDQVLQPSHEHLTRVSFERLPGEHRAVLSASLRDADFAPGSRSYPASVVLGLLAGTAMGCVAAVHFVRRVLWR